MTRTKMGIHLKKLAGFGYLIGLFFLVSGMFLSTSVKPVAAQVVDQPTIAFDQDNSSICLVINPPTLAIGNVPMTVTGHYHVPAGMTARLQTLFYIVHPVPTPFLYTDLGIVSGDGTFSVSGYWPGIFDGTAVVENHFGANLLDPVTGVPLVNVVGSLDFWWNPGDCGLTPTPVTPTATTVTPTDVTPTTVTPITPTGVTPTTVTPITPTGVTPTTVTPITPTGVTPTTVTPTTVTPTTVTPTGITPTGITPTGITPQGVTPTPDDNHNVPLIPVTGVDRTGGSGSILGNQNLLLDLGLLVLGLSLICFGVAHKLKRNS